MALGGFIFAGILLVAAFTAIVNITEKEPADRPIPFSERYMKYNPNDKDANDLALRRLLQTFLNVAENRVHRHADIVLIGHGSYSSPPIWHTGHSNLRAVVLYQPYGTVIDTDVAFRIYTGDIHLGERRFYRNITDNRPDYLYDPPNNWNRITSNPWVKVPTVWLSPLESNHLGFRIFELSLRTARQSGNRILIAYTGEGPPRLLWSMAKDFAKVASQLRVEITVHWAACLSYEASLFDSLYPLIDNICSDQYALYKGVMKLNDAITTSAVVDDVGLLF